MSNSSGPGQAQPFCLARTRPILPAKVTSMQSQQTSNIYCKQFDSQCHEIPCDITLIAKMQKQFCSLEEPDALNLILLHVSI